MEQSIYILRCFNDKLPERGKGANIKFGRFEVARDVYSPGRFGDQVALTRFS